MNDLDEAGEFGVPGHAFQKNSKEQIRLGVSEYKGKEYIDIRTFYKSPDGWKPSPRGVTIPPTLYSELYAGIVEVGIQLGLIDADAFSGHPGVQRLQQR